MPSVPPPGACSRPATTASRSTSATAHLIEQSLSPFSNTRTDACGGSLDGRLRFTHEVLAAVQEQAPDLPMGIRVSGDEFLPGGLPPPGMVEMVDLLRRSRCLRTHW